MNPSRVARALRTAIVEREVELTVGCVGSEAEVHADLLIRAER
jgi:hypothetical protein